MTETTTKAIKEYSKDYRNGDALVALMDYYDVPNLMQISEENARKFLEKLKSGEIKI